MVYFRRAVAHSHVHSCFIGLWTFLCFYDSCHGCSLLYYGYSDGGGVLLCLLLICVIVLFVCHFVKWKLPLFYMC